jgi:ankyrin repeat protein
MGHPNNPVALVRKPTQAKGRERVLSLAELLINKGADLNAKNKDGRTPLAHAIRIGNAAVAEVIRRYAG